jgi:beta-phosphoglucomutase
MEKLRAILFDCDGTIADNEPIHLRMFQAVLRDLGIDLTEKDYYDIYLGMDDQDCFRSVLEANGKPAPPELIRTLIERKAGLYESAIRKELRVYPGVVRLVRAAAARYELAVVSGALRAELELILQAANIREAFKVITSAEDVSAGKPDPEGFIKGLAALNGTDPRPDPPIRPAECLVIEDSFAGVDAAKAADMRCLAVTNSYPRDVLKKADRVVDTLEAVTPESLEALLG